MIVLNRSFLKMEYTLINVPQVLKFIISIWILQTIFPSNIALEIKSFIKPTCTLYSYNQGVIDLVIRI
jgi:hypothetical protein